MNNLVHYLIIQFLSILFLGQFLLVNASIGDRSVYYRKCINRCYEKYCYQKRPHEFDKKQSIYLKYLGWDCPDECKYECMWQTVEYFTEIEKRKVPQFYGKWPFKRILGIQEPASALASILNLLANLYMINKMRNTLSYHAPFKPLWYLFGVVSVNTWIWSTIFHTRDIDFTEKMDYFSAFSLVLFQFNSFFVRILQLRKNILTKLIMHSITAMSIYYYCHHVYYLSFIHFDYGYNMKINILFGMLNSVCWISWSLYKFFYEGRKYVWRCTLAVLLVDVLMSLEIFDFSPIFWFLDSHALWHISTICIPFFWYQFIIDDSYYIDLNNKSVL